jgi:hypothetical protein
MSKNLSQDKGSCSEECNTCEFRMENLILLEKVHTYQTILENMEKKYSLEQLGELISKTLNLSHPIYNYIFENAKENQIIKKIFFFEVEKVRNLLFVIKPCNFKNKKILSELMQKLMQTFNNSLFDFMIVSLKDLEKFDLEEEGYDILYDGDIVNA